MRIASAPILLSAALLALAACKPATETPTATAPATTQPPQSAPAPTPSEATAPAATPGDQTVNDAIDRVLGDHAAYQTAFTQLQHAVAEHDAASVAALVDYPFTATLDGKRGTLKDAAAFTAQYDRIVTPAIADAIAKQEYADLMVSAKGVMLGSGEVWLNGVCRDPACAAAQEVKVIAIQPGATP